MVSEAFGGIATYSQVLLKALNENFKVEAYPIWIDNRNNDSRDELEEFLPDNGTILRAERFIDYNELFRTIESDPSEIIHFQFDTSLFSSEIHFWELLCRIKESTGKKIVITMHSVFTDRTFVNHIRKCLRKVDCLIVHQENCRKFLLSEGIDSSKITVIPHGTPVSDFHFSEQGLFKTNRFKIAMTGFLKKSKAFHKAISSLIYNSNLEIIVAGLVKEKEVIQAIERLQKSRETKAIIRLIPRYLTDQELHSLIHEANCVIQPYSQEYYSSSGILHLAAGMGKVLLLSPSPKFKELTSRIPFCEVRDNDYMKRVEKLRTSSELVSEIEREIRSFARETEWSIVASKTHSLYERIASNSITIPHGRLTVVG